MPLISCKVHIKLKWTKYCVLASNGYNNTNANRNNTIFTIKDTKLYVPVIILSVKTIKNYQNFSAKNLKDQCVEMNIKQKVRIRIRQMSIDIILSQTL